MIFFSQNLKFPTLKLGPVRVISKIGNLASKYDCSNPCSFRDVTLFVIFSKNFRKLKLLLVFENLKFPTLYLGPVKVLSKIANLESKYDCSILFVFEIWRFLWFFQKFSENLNYYYFFINLKFLTLYLVLSEYSQGSQDL